VIVTAALTGCGSQNGTRRHVVEITGFAFRPDTLHVAPGDTVVWVNGDVVPHTATARGDGWDSGTLEADGSWTYVAGSRGESSYVCTLHPSMTGLIMVR
jgi:plastocyanin